MRWVTLTYRENMQDSRRLYEDFRRFWQRFKRWCASSGFAIPEYITIAEPQARGAWHLHGIFVFPGVAPYIPPDDFARLWGQGFIKVKAVTGDNLGAYFSAYLTDLPVDEVDKDILPSVSSDRVREVEVDDESGEKVKKKFVKGARCSLPEGSGCRYEDRWWPCNARTGSGRC